MNLDIPDIHDPASVSLHVTGFCEDFTEMLSGRKTTREAYVYRVCVQRLMKEVEEQTGQHHEHRLESEGLDTAKVLCTFEQWSPFELRK